MSRAPLLFTVALTLALLPVSAVPAQAAVLPLTQHVNPFIGTDDSNSPNPVPGGAGGSTVPGPVAPFGMVQFSPDTPTASPSGYRFSDTQIQEFSLTHFNGAGCANNEDIGFLPITGNIGTSPGTGWTSYQQTQTKASEVAVAGYYKAVLGGTTAELSATKRSGIMRLTYPATTTAKVLINNSRSATGNRSGSLTISGSTVSGTFTGGGFCGSSKTYQIFWYAQFDRSPTSVGTWVGGTVNAGSTSSSGVNSGAYLNFDTSGNAVVQMKVGISFVSIANAQANLNAEQSGFAFDTVRSNLDTEWNTILNRVQATGGSAADLQKFYTALYRVLINPNIASDVNGQYRGFDQAVRTSSRTVYQNYSGWDIYRSWASLIALIAPNEAADMAQSMVLDGQQGGLLPKWSHNSNEHFVMTGDPGPVIVSSMNAFGVTNFDTASALTLMNSSSNGGTMQGSPIRGRQSGYVSRHYVYEDPSDSLEYSASDFAVAQFAQRQGTSSLYNTYMTRAQWWANVFSTESSYIHRRNADATWTWPLDPAADAGYTEGNASQYTWMVTYNFASLIDLMGGPLTAKQRLDHHFTELNGGLTRPYFYIGNEPEHGVPWAYNYARYPAGASSTVRRVMTESFTTGAGGLPGNDDLGATSAWYVWGALGMYPPTPGADVLALHGPLFSSVLIDRPGGDITITSSGSGQYVQSFSLNGTAQSKSFLRWPQLSAGATLSYTMGGSPSASWGTGAADVPPSFQDGWTPPPAAPSLGTNLALNKPASSNVAACNATEGPAKAFDGVLSATSKWCSSAAGTKQLQVDLGSSMSVSSFVVKHAALGGENSGWNTGAFNILTSTDGTNWTTRATVSGNRSSRTYHPISAVSARYVRLDVTTPANNGNTAARIDEFEVYGGATPGPSNVALNKAATADSSCNTNEGPAKAVNGSVTGGNTDKWCSLGATKWWQVDLASAFNVQSVTIRHAGAGGENAAWNTRDFTIQVSSNGTSWTTVATVTGNTANVTNHPLTAVSARYVRVNISAPTSTTDNAARVYEIEVYA